MAAGLWQRTRHGRPALRIRPSDLPTFPTSTGEDQADYSKGYSRAFERFVEGRDDVVGLLAYAMFKETVSEEARQGNITNGATRNPTRATVRTFRMAAERTINSVVERAIEEAKPDIEQNATAVALASSESELKSHIDSRTSFPAALRANLVAWLISLALTVAIIFIYLHQSVEQTITKAMEPAPQQLPAPPQRAVPRK